MLSMVRLGLLLAALPAWAEGALESPIEVSSPFTLSAGRIPFKDPIDQTGNDGFSWDEPDGDDYYYAEYYYYEYDDVFDYYRGSGEYFEYYYAQTADPIAKNQQRLIEAGAVSYQFACNQALSDLSIEPVFVDVRRLEISVAYYYTSVMDLLRGGDYNDYDYYYGFDYEYYYQNDDDEAAAPGSYAVDVWLKSVTVADVSDNLGKLQATGMRKTPSDLVTVTPGYHAAQLHAEGTSVETGLSFTYECFGTGQSLVRVMLSVKSAKTQREDICINWIKQCSLALPYIGIEDGDLEDVVVENAVAKNNPMLKSPVTETFTFFFVRMMAHDGVIRLRVPEITSKHKDIGDVDVRMEDMENNYMQVAQVRTRIVVDYTCYKQGDFPVVMVLQRDWSMYTQALQFTWMKKCDGTGSMTEGVTTGELEVSIYSPTYENKTHAVHKGSALPGFKRPCPRPGVSRTRHKDEAHALTEYRPPPKACSNEVPKYVVPRSDKSTTLHWKWDNAVSAYEFEDLVIGYNPRLMEAKISSDWESYQSYVKYVCFADGVGNVTVTAYSKGRKPMDFAWRKICTEPSAPHTGKAITASVAVSIIVMAMVLCAICVLVGFYLVVLRNSDKANATDVEVASIVGNREEVTVHEY